MLKFQQPVVVTNDGGKYITKVETGRVTLYGDEPVEKGGQDMGATAHQLFWLRWEPAQPSQYVCTRKEKNGMSRK